MKILKRPMRGDDVRQLQRKLKILDDGIFGRLTEEAVMELQRKHGLEPDGIVGAKTWAVINDDAGLKKSNRTITEIIVHCTASPEGRNLDVAAIRRMHIKERGWSDIGYHYVVYLDGSIHAGRPLNISGAHCTGHNTHSIGVVYVGGLDKQMKAKDTRTPAQKAGLLKLLKDLKKFYPKATIHGHREFARKDCPCFDAKAEYKNL
jgi:N-acetylmuramoyl-L-alanine amidase